MDKFDDLIPRESTDEISSKILREPSEERNAFETIIAMKGDSYTGKTTCADAIARYYRCSVISFDDILDSLSPSSPEEKADRLTDLAFDVVLRLVKLQIQIERPVVVDSPLTDRRHLDRLLRLAGEFGCGIKSCPVAHCKFVIVECRPERKKAWKEKFEKRDRDQTHKWYKPREWKDVKKSPSVEFYVDGELPSFVCRLIVDTTGSIDHRNLGPATLDLSWCAGGHLLRKFGDWLPTKPVHDDVTFLKTTSFPTPSQQRDADQGINQSKCGLINVVQSRREMGKFDDLDIRESETKIRKKLLYEAEEMYFFKMIIAMKGDPYTGKTTCAEAIAKSYRCSVISYDDILDSLSPGSPASPQEADRLRDLAFDVVLRVVKLQLGIDRAVVIDSPLTDRRHLDRLLNLASKYLCGNELCDKIHVKFVIVECRPEVDYVWQVRFGKRDNQAPHKYWFKPKEWNDVKQSPSVESYHVPGDLPGYVSRLIVDTTDYVDYDNLGPATFDLCWCPKGHLYDFQDWRPSWSIHSGFSFLKTKTTHPPEQGKSLENATTANVECGTDGHHLLEEETDLEGAASLGCCRACQVPISNPPAYACKHCKLALHKSCAELKEKTMIPPHQLPSFLRIRDTVLSVDSIPEEYRHRCSSCQVAGKQFTTECELCLWETHLRSGLVPTILSHEGHAEHLLCFWISSSKIPREYQCHACQLPGAFAGYTCLKSYFSVNVHVECALLPHPMRHVHGGYEHDMRLVLGTEETEEDYLCDVCGGPRNPTAWYYYCHECVFASHLHCVYASEST